MQRFRAICARPELEAQHRWQTVKLLEQGVPYLEIAGRVPTSTATVTRVAQWLHHGTGGYRIVLDRLKKASLDGARHLHARRLERPADHRLPVAGATAPALRLCSDAGLSFETTERALLVPCANAPVDLLLVRAHDVPEYVQDGVVDLGITGANLVAEAGADVARSSSWDSDVARCRLRFPKTLRSRLSRSSTACGSRPRIPCRRRRVSPRTGSRPS